MDEIMLFDATGKRMYQKKNVDSQDVILFDFLPRKQFVLVKVVLKDGKSITKKIIY
jgi:ethanolamine utilization microcompartment shell protein EutS